MYYNINDLFNELNSVFIDIGSEIIVLYPSPFRKFYYIINKLLYLFEQGDKSEYIDLFIYNNCDKIKKIFLNVFGDFVENLSEDNFIIFFFKFIEINLPNNEEKRETNNNKEIIKVGGFVNLLKKIILNCNDILKQYIKLKKCSFEDDFGNISDIKTICKLIGNECTPSCKFFDIECKYRELSSKYISFKGMITLINIISEGYLEEKNFYYKLITGDDLIDKISNENIKKEIYREDNKLRDDEKEKIIENIKNIIINSYSKLNLEILSKISNSGNKIYTKIKNKTITPDDLTIDELLKIMINNENVFCDILKYIIFIRDKLNNYEFPYDEDYSPKKAKEEYETYQSLSEDKKKSYKAWDKERYELFIDGYNEKDIIKMKISYNNYYWTWYKYIIKRIPKFEELMIKYIIDKILNMLTFTFAHGIYIFDNENNVTKLKKIFNNIINCIDINLNEMIYNGNIYILDRNKLNEYKEKKKNPEKKGNFSISYKNIINNIDEFIKNNVIIKKEEKILDIIKNSH